LIMLPCIFTSTLFSFFLIFERQLLHQGIYVGRFIKGWFQEKFSWTIKKEDK
jgi:hypothetical protein